MDYELILTQSVITVLTLLFLLVVYWLKLKIEYKFRKTTENMEQSKVRMKAVAYQEKLLWKKVLDESTNRHQRSIITSSLQTLEDELEKLHRISSTVIRTKQTPLLNLEKSFLPEMDGSGFSFGDQEESPKQCEKREVKKENRPLQSRLCKTWGFHTEKELGTNRNPKRKPMMPKWNNTSFKNSVKNQRLLTKKHQRKLFEMNNAFVYFANVFRSNNNNKAKSSKVDLQNENLKINTSSNITMSLIKNAKKAYSETNFSCGADYKVQNVKRYSSSCNDFNSLSGKKQRNSPQTKKRSNYSCSDRSLLDCLNTKKNSSFKGVSTNDLIFTEIANQSWSIEENSISCSQIGPLEKKTLPRHKHNFKIDLFCPVNILIPNKNKSIILSEDFGDGKNMTNFEAFRLCITHDFSRQKCCIYKVPIKVGKRKIILKFNICLITKVKNQVIKVGHKISKTKRFHHLNRRFSPYVVNKLQEKHLPLQKKSHHKRLNLYTDATSSTAKQIQNCADQTFCDLDNFVSLGVGDNALSTIHPVKIPEKHASIDAEKEYFRYSLNNEFDNRKEINDAIFKQCIELTKDNFRDYLDICCGQFPNLIYRFTNGKNVLSTIQEDPAEEFIEYLDKTSEGRNVNIAKVTSENKYFKDNKEIERADEEIISKGMNQKKIKCASFNKSLEVLSTDSNTSISRDLPTGALISCNNRGDNLTSSDNESNTSTISADYSSILTSGHQSIDLVKLDDHLNFKASSKNRMSFENHTILKHQDYIKTEIPIQTKNLTGSENQINTLISSYNQSNNTTINEYHSNNCASTCNQSNTVTSKENPSDNLKRLDTRKSEIGIASNHQCKEKVDSIPIFDIKTQTFRFNQELTNPKILTCFFDLKNVDGTLQDTVPRVHPNLGLHYVDEEESFKKEDSDSLVVCSNNSKTKQMFYNNDKFFCSGSDHSWQSEDQNVICDQALSFLGGMKIEKGILLERVQTDDSLIMSESVIYIQNAAEGFEGKTQNSSSTLFVMEGTLIGSTDDIGNNFWCTSPRVEGSESEFSAIDSVCSSASTCKATSRNNLETVWRNVDRVQEIE